MDDYITPTSNPGKTKESQLELTLKCGIGLKPTKFNPQSTGKAMTHSTGSIIVYSIFTHMPRIVSAFAIFLYLLYKVEFISLLHISISAFFKGES
jgi:hypothetical protein